MKISQELFESIFNDQFKYELITRLNADINIPIINEKTEASILNTIYDVVENLANEIIVK